jgi:hypothetical protein
MSLTLLESCLLVLGPFTLLTMIITNTTEHTIYSKVPQAIWYSLLRPEFVKTQKLCSDLYSSFMSKEPNRTKLEMVKTIH